MGGAPGDRGAYPIGRPRSDFAGRRRPAWRPGWTAHARQRLAAELRTRSSAAKPRLAFVMLEPLVVWPCVSQGVSEAGDGAKRRRQPVARGDRSTLRLAICARSPGAGAPGERARAGDFADPSGGNLPYCDRQSCRQTSSCNLSAQLSTMVLRRESVQASGLRRRRHRDASS